jgi:hypothetical protein
MTTRVGKYPCAEPLVKQPSSMALHEDDNNRRAAERWTSAMLRGDFLAAWNESDAIRSRGLPDPHRFWQGESLIGKRVMIRCLHGFGDAIQFLSYAPRLRTIAARVLVECSPRAVDLIRCLPGIDEVLAWGDTIPPWDAQIELMELPYIFRTTIADLPIAIEYLHLPGMQRELAAQALSAAAPTPRIGLAWSAGDWNPLRSIPLPMLKPVLDRDGCEFWNLQGGDVREQWQTLLARSRLCDTPALADAGLVPLAAIIAHLDLVITVDTLAAHLAGALGIPCFLMLQHAPDWRWMLDREDSPWYPSLRLIRQPAPSDWASIIVKLECALAEWQLTWEASRSAR